MTPSHTPHAHRVGLFVAVTVGEDTTNPMEFAEHWLRNLSVGTMDLVRAELLDCAPDHSDPGSAILVPLLDVPQIGVGGTLVWSANYPDHTKTVALVEMPDGEAALLWVIHKHNEVPTAWVTKLADVFHSLAHLLDGTHCRGPFDPEPAGGTSAPKDATL